LALFTSAILFCLSVPQIQSFLLLYLHLHWVFFLPTQMFSNPSSEFSILVLVLFSFRRSFWFILGFLCVQFYFQFVHILFLYFLHDFLWLIKSL
jgi:hypothetical protein